MFYTTTTSSSTDDSKDDEKVKKAKSESTPGAPSVAFGTLEEALENMWKRFFSSSSIVKISFLFALLKKKQSHADSNHAERVVHEREQRV